MLIPALIIIAAAVYLMVRRVEVRLVLLGAGLLMAALAGKPLAVFDEFTRAMVAAMVAPICAAMGFAAVLGATGCDRALVHLLLIPLRRFRPLVLPGGIAAAYLVNMAVPSQTSTAAALGPILVPLMLAAALPAEVAGAALILGASFGGDLLNPGAQDVQGLAGATGLPAPAISARVIPATIAGLVVAALVYAVLNRKVSSGAAADAGSATNRAGRVVSAPNRCRPRPRPGPRKAVEDQDEDENDNESENDNEDEDENEDEAPSPVHPPPNHPITQLPNHLLKALIPLVPIALLLAAYAGWKPLGWLLSVPAGEDWKRLANALPVVRAMLIGALLAAAVGWREIQAVTRSLFEGLGAAYGSIISLTITAQCFGAGIAAIGVSDALLRLLGGSPFLTRFLAAAFPWALAVLSGSGSGPVLTFGQTFLTHVSQAPDAPTLAALACLGGAFGRTMSPVAAVVIYTSGLTGVSPILLVRNLLPALLCGAAVSVAVAATLH